MVYKIMNLIQGLILEVNQANYFLVVRMDLTVFSLIVYQKIE